MIALILLSSSAAAALIACGAPTNATSGADLNDSDAGKKKSSTAKTAHAPRPGDEGPIEVPPPLSPSSPKIETMQPVSVGVSAAGTDVTLTGVNFANEATVIVGGETLHPTTVSTTSLTVSVPAAHFKSAGSVPFKVQNPTESGGASNPLALTVASASSSIALASISPSEATAGSNDVSITVTGSGFTNKMRIRFNGTDVTTTGGGSTLTGKIPAALLRLPGSLSVAVYDPASSSMTAPAPFTVDKAPASSASGSCTNRCVDFGFKADQCLDDWTCDDDGSCLTQKACTPACKYNCTDYDYANNQCVDGWQCTNGCLQPKDCGTTTTSSSGSNNGATSCTYDCVDKDGAWSYSAGECRNSYECGTDNCLHAKVCSTGTSTAGGSCQWQCNDPDGAWTYATGECKNGFSCGADGCLKSQTCATDDVTTGTATSCEYQCNDPDGFWTYANGECKNGYQCGADSCLHQKDCSTLSAGTSSCTACVTIDYSYDEGSCQDGMCCLGGCLVTDPSP